MIKRSGQKVACRRSRVYSLPCTRTAFKTRVDKTYMKHAQPHSLNRPKHIHTTTPIHAYNGIRRRLAVICVERHCAQAAAWPVRRKPASRVQQDRPLYIITAPRMQRRAQNTPAPPIARSRITSPRMQRHASNSPDSLIARSRITFQGCTDALRTVPTHLKHDLEFHTKRA